MQATQIGSIETLSVPGLQKVSASTQPSDSPEGFGDTLHRDMLAANVEGPDHPDRSGDQSAELSGRAKQLAPKYTDESPATATTPGQGRMVTEKPAIAGLAEAMPLPVLQPAPATKVVGLPAPETKTAVAPETRMESANVKRAARTGEPANFSGVLNAPQQPSVPAAVVAPTEVQVLFPAAAVTCADVPQKVTSDSSPMAAATLSPAPIPGSSSSVAKIGRTDLASQGQTGTEVLPSASERQEFPTAPVPSKSQHGPGLAEAEMDASATNIHANPVATSSPHPNQTSTLNAGTQTPAPLNSAPPSARTDLQPHVAPNLDAAGLSGVHVLPSGPTQLDVGVLDSTHGWLRIRAELGARGAVSASLTASPLAHESLNAALPEMAKYLGTEAVSVTKLVVHSFSDGPDKTALGTEANQQNGSAHERHPAGENVLEGADGQKQESAFTDQRETAATITMIPTAPVSNAAFTDRPISESNRLAPPSRWPFAALEGIRGNWLNVCA